MASPLLEIACFNLQSALVAQTAGADRVELCDNYVVGGLSPDKTILLSARQQLHIPFFVMIRCRPGNFVYKANEMEMMLETVSFCQSIGVKGIVFGALTAEGKIDLFACEQIAKVAGNMSLTFHRAIDECVSPEEDIERIAAMGFNRLLTSGKQTTALLGSEKIKTWQTRFKQQIIVMPGGGIRAANIAQIKHMTNCVEFHSAAITTNPQCCDAQEILQMKKALS